RVRIHLRALGIGQTNLDRKLDSVPDKSPLDFPRCEGELLRVGHFFPGALLAFYYLDAGFDLSQRSAVGYPRDFEAGLFFAVLYTDDVAGFQGMADAQYLRTFAAEIAGNGVLREGASVRVHTPHANM
ncbi:MAG: hypothetical protein WAN17_00390, partial [Candidatus Sulfotelmatobacter sp.]